MALQAESVQCIFDGTKFFWRTRTNLDVCIIEHNKYDIYEVIIYEPSCDIETPRIYLNGKVLRSKVEKYEVDSKLSFATRNNLPLTEKFVIGVINKCIADFLMNRINILKFISEEKHIDVEIQLSQLDIALGIMEPLFCNKPDDLIPYTTKHYKTVMADVVKQTMETLQHEKESLHETCEAANILSKSNDKPLTIKERWRMPLVIVKVNHSKRLNWIDSRIFQKIQSNMKTDHDLRGMKAIMRSRSGSTNNNTTTSSSNNIISSRRNSSSSCSTPRHSTMKRSSFSPKTMQEGHSSLHRALLNREDHEGTPRNRSNRANSLRHPSHRQMKKHAVTPTTTNIDGNSMYDSDITTTAGGGIDAGVRDNEDVVTASNFSKVLARLNALGGSMQASFGINSTPTAFSCIHEAEENNPGEGILTTEGLEQQQQQHQQQQQQVSVQYMSAQRRGSSTTSTPRHSHYHILQKSSLLSASSPSHTAGAHHGGLTTTTTSSFHRALLNREDHEGTPRNRNSRAHPVRLHSNRHLKKHAVTPTTTNIDGNSYAGHGYTTTTSAVEDDWEGENDDMVTANNFGKVLASLNALGSTLRSSFGVNSTTTPCIEEAGEVAECDACVDVVVGRGAGEPGTGLVSPAEPYTSGSVPRALSKSLLVEQGQDPLPSGDMGNTADCSALASVSPSEGNMKALLEVKPLTAHQLQQEQRKQEEDKQIEQSVRARPAQRGSMLMSFMLAISGRQGSSSVNNTSSESSKSGSVSGRAVFPSLSRFLQWGTGAEGKVVAAQ